jgi:alpha-mannosidase
MQDTQSDRFTDFNTPLKIRQQASQEVEIQAIHSPIQLVEGTQNLVLETIKRGDSDDFSGKATEQSVVLRFFDAYGGAAKGRVSMLVAAPLALR